MAEPIVNEARVEQNLVEPSTESNVKYELGEELLKELHSNTYSGRVEEDVVGHIAKILEILDLIKVADMDPFQLRMKTFPLSLSGDARKCKGIATTWKELGDKFFHKYYPLSHAYKSKIPYDLDHGTDYFEFIYWLASKFDNYWELDKNIKNGLWEFYVNGQTKGTIEDLVKYNKPCEENNKKTCLDLFFKPYLDAQDGKDIYEFIDRDYSSIPIPTHHDIGIPNELCQTEEFTVVRYSIGSCEEFITVGPSKINTMEKPLASCLVFTTNSLIKKIVDGP
ncbi:hypothetical protein Tco_0960478 [Tanacetum coccineum]